LTHTFICKLCAAGVERDPGHGWWSATLKDVFDHLAFFKRREVTCALPKAWVGVNQSFSVTFAEGFLQGVVVSEVVDGDFVEVIETDFLRQIFGPVIVATRIGGTTARIDLRESVGTSADWWCQCGVAKGLGIGCPAVEDRSQCDEEWQFTVAAIFKVQLYGALPGFFEVDDFSVPTRIWRAAMIADGFQRKDNVFNG